MIVENKEQLVEFTKHYDSEDSIVIPIFCDDTKHPVETEISLNFSEIELITRERAQEGF